MCQSIQVLTHPLCITTNHCTHIMESFLLHEHFNELDSKAPRIPNRPVVGITTNYEGIDATLRSAYYRQIVEAGGTPMLIPPVNDNDVIMSTLDHIDALLLTGGADFNPLWHGDEPIPGLHHINRERDLPELMLTRYAYYRQIPILGICRGMQTLAIALDGHIQQDLPNAEVRMKHSQDADREEPTHTVFVQKDTLLKKIYNCDRMFVNSFHHQAVDEAGDKLRVSATAADKVVEAVESNEHKPILGVQWHPEWLGKDGQPLFKWLVDEARLLMEARRFHRRNITAYSHCDTPMFFPQGIDFEQRDPRILYDLHKMRDGGPDAVTMVAYLPQPKEGERFVDIAPFKVDGPRAYADLIFDKIDETVLAHSGYIALARNRAEIETNKRADKKSLMIGIENGLALEDDLKNVEHFAKRGIVYITLCHNGDNQICDSARKSACTHGGVSPFGEQVIHEMNRLGLMVDLSHAGERSFYDALEISKTPIVCSHSNAKALCDVPRNLTDEQMKALAAKGGVCQITLYNGFLRTDGKACINDAMAHLYHAIDVMGIDHVGLGTDFDGDGGVPGLADASELINFTKALLRRRFSEEDMAKIWGGNWLRVMEAVQGL